jgi:Zn-dependent protease
MIIISRIIDWFFVLSAYLCATYLVTSLFENISGGLFVAASLAFALLAIPAILFHELGHAWAAYAQGWKVHAINVSGLSYLPAKPCFRFEAPMGNGDIGGFVVMTTPKPANWAGEYQRIVFAGPAANLLCALIFAIGASFSAGDTAVICWAFAVTNLVMGLHNLLPRPLSDGISNDGHMLLRIAQGYRIAPYELAHQKIAGMGYDGTHHSLWLEQIAEIEGFSSLSSGEIAGIHGGLFNLAFNQGNLEIAYKIWKEHLAGKWDLGETTHLCCALCSILCGHGTQEAREILDQTECSSPAIEFYWWRSKVAIEMTEGDYPQAVIAAHKAERAAILARLNPDKDDRAMFRAARTGQPLVWPDPKRHPKHV